MRPFAKLAIGLCFLFVVTITVMVASAFATEKTALLVALDRFGLAIVGLEVAAILFALLGARFEHDPNRPSLNAIPPRTEEFQTPPSANSQNGARSDDTMPLD